MTRLSFSSLRSRLMLLLLLAVVPALGLILYTGLEERRQEAAAAQEETMRLVRIAAADQGRLIDATRQLLTVLAQLPAVRRGDPVACNALFVDLLRQYPAYANLGMADLEGDIFSSAAPLTQPVNAAGRALLSASIRSAGSPASPSSCAAIPFWTRRTSSRVSSSLVWMWPGSTASQPRRSCPGRLR